MTRSHGLRAEPAFVRWASAEGISLVGSAVTTIVLPLVVFEATGSITQTGALYAVRVVPYLLFGIIAGPIADQGNRRLLDHRRQRGRGAARGDDPHRPRASAC